MRPALRQLLKKAPGRTDQEIRAMTENPRRLDARSAPGALQIEHCDVPDGMTLGEWRRSCAAARRAADERDAAAPKRRGLRRLLRG